MSEGYKDFENKLIEAVRNSDVLYDKKHKQYFNKNLKEKCWNDISLEVGRSIEECKSRWKTLREKFVKENRTCPSGSAVVESTWPYLEEMLFLREYVQPRKTRSNENVVHHATESTTDFDIDILNESAEMQLETMENERSSINSKKSSASSALKAIEEAAEAVKSNVSQMAATSKASDCNTVDENLARTIVSIIHEVPENYRDEVRSKLFLYVIELKKQYINK